MGVPSWFGRVKAGAGWPMAGKKPYAAAAQEALERAESRALVRSVRPSRASQPSEQGIVADIAAARHALAAGDRALALDKISAALASKDADAAPE